MAELTEQEQIRRNSLNELKKLGINPYPAALYEVNAKSSEILEKFPQDNTLFQDFEEALRWQQMLLDKEGVKIIYAE